jgi:hypothetical protein
MWKQSRPRWAGYRGDYTHRETLLAWTDARCDDTRSRPSEAKRGFCKDHLNAIRFFIATRTEPVRHVSIKQPQVAPCSVVLGACFLRTRTNGGHWTASLVHAYRFRRSPIHPAQVPGPTVQCRWCADYDRPFGNTLLGRPRGRPRRSQLRGAAAPYHAVSYNRVADRKVVDRWLMDGPRDALNPIAAKPHES